jgi:hypothetical protein
MDAVLIIAYVWTPIVSGVVFNNKSQKTMAVDSNIDTENVRTIDKRLLVM